jgi:hypothetical protein
MYQLDTAEAKRADSTGNQIKEIGKYVGTFTQAADITAKTGTKGIAFNFVTSTGQKARCSIYTMKADGTKLGGYGTLSAMMACLKLRTLAPVAGKITGYDYDTNQDTVTDGNIFPDLCKPIGVLLETEEYLKRDNSTGSRMVLKGVFQADTELTASEILERKTKPEQLEKMVAALRHRPLKAPAAQPTRTHAHADSGFDSFEDDSIPF